MYDLKNRRIFLKRSQYPNLTLEDLYLGAAISIYSRQLKVVEYGDNFTKSHFENQRERTFAMIKPDCYNHIGKIIDRIIQEGFKITNIKMHRFTVNQARQLYSEHDGKQFFQDLVNFISSDISVGMELIAGNAISKWKDIIGPANSHTARVDAPQSIRAAYGSDGARNAVHGSESADRAAREIDYFFSLPGNTATYSNCTCCVIKPHALTNAGRIIDMIISEGFEISALQMFNLDKPNAEEFLDVYKGVLPEFSGIVEHFTSGPCIAMEIRQENPVESFREICGPLDPDVARSSKPRSIRAIFGIDRIQNAVHCTDLPEDGLMESEYFFRILSKN
ncbi:NME7_1 [Blepharisma stoltei]|uniref:DM10 domain-containing protein n=1 Tax=Blepharisma stoltei TaxID=1481888 RepID=A0AAU9IFN8_9CILI|nr:unnamed protein product [Blepharisma stoltei]